MTNARGDGLVTASGPASASFSYDAFGNRTTTYAYNTGSGSACLSAGLAAVGLGSTGLGALGVEYSVVAGDPIGFMLQSSARLAPEAIDSRESLAASAIASSWMALTEKQP